tara:strand:- start:42 stop:686 length:645 start_codon:yes stop_codon:yes gene_type:complete
MTDRPILFSAPMVRALLAGRKTQTRRIASFIVPAGEQYHVRNAHGGWFGPASRVPEVAPNYAPYAVGDRLWVKETWLSTPAYDDLKPSELGGEEPLLYVADSATFNWREADGHRRGKTRVSIFMPRWASRITLTVTDVRVERLQDCSEADAVAEGIEQYGRFFGLPDTNWDQAELSAVAAYQRLWNSINGEGSWEANPWVVAVSFDVLKGNIDG